MLESGDLEGEKTPDFGRPGRPSGPGDGEAFLAKGLLRTEDMTCALKADG